MCVQQVETGKKHLKAFDMRVSIVPIAFELSKSATQGVNVDIREKQMTRHPSHCSVF